MPCCISIKLSMEVWDSLSNTSGMAPLPLKSEAMDSGAAMAPAMVCQFFMAVAMAAWALSLARLPAVVPVDSRSGVAGH
jgi:hypothetical protein